MSARQGVIEFGPWHKADHSNTGLDRTWTSGVDYYAYARVTWAASTVRGEDYPALAAIWENAEDDYPPTPGVGTSEGETQ